MDLVGSTVFIIPSTRPCIIFPLACVHAITSSAQPSAYAHPLTNELFARMTSYVLHLFK